VLPQPIVLNSTKISDTPLFFFLFSKEFVFAVCLTFPPLVPLHGSLFLQGFSLYFFFPLSKEQQFDRPASAPSSHPLLLSLRYFFPPFPIDLHRFHDVSFPCQKSLFLFVEDASEMEEPLLCSHPTVGLYLF